MIFPHGQQRRGQQQIQAQRNDENAWWFHRLNPETTMTAFGFNRHVKVTQGGGIKIFLALGGSFMDEHC